MDSLLPILSEQAPSQNAKNALTTVTVPQQLPPPPDELILPPVLVPKLQMNKSPASAAVPYHTTHMEPFPSTSTATDYKYEPLSLEMFNHVLLSTWTRMVLSILKNIRNIYTSHLIKIP